MGGGLAVAEHLVGPVRPCREAHDIAGRESAGAVGSPDRGRAVEHDQPFLGVLVVVRTEARVRGYLEQPDG